MALAENPEQFRSVAAVFDQLQHQERLLETEVQQTEQASGRPHDLETEVALALSGLDRLADLASAPRDLGGVGMLFQQLNARMFFHFVESKWKKRVVNKVASGIVTFGTAPPPVPFTRGPQAAGM